MNRLMLCSGITRREGWVTLDSDPKFGADIVASIPPLPQEVKAKQWDEIELIHGITSFYPWDAEQLLCEIRGVLASGGKLVLEQPDAWWAAKAIIDDGGDFVKWFFGDSSLRNPEHMNKWAYTPEILEDTLHRAGFLDVHVRKAEYHNPRRDFRMEAYA